MRNLIIRSAKTEDIEKIITLLIELGRPRPNKNDKKVFSELIQSYLDDFDKEILIVKNSSDVIGMISIMYLTRLNQKQQEMYIPELIIQKEFRNTGIGKKLINAAIELAKKKNCHRIRLESGNQRTESHMFYEKNNFEQSALSFDLKIK